MIETPAAPAIPSDAPGRAPSAPPALSQDGSVFLSVGTKMLAATAGLMVASFLICGSVALLLAQRMVRSDLQAKVTQESAWLAEAGRRFMVRPTAADKAQLARLVGTLANESEILGVRILDPERHVLAHSRGPAERRFGFFSLRMPVRDGAKTIGFVEAQYSPVRALEEMWTTTGHLVVLLFAATFSLFAIILFLVIERMVNRPFRRFLRELENGPQQLRPLAFDTDRRDEWGLLGKQLNRYLSELGDLQERSAVLYDAARMLSVPDGLREALEALFTGLLHRYRLTTCLLLVKDERFLRVEAFAGVSEEFAEKFTVNPGDGVAGIVFASGQPRHVARITPEDPDPLLGELARRQQIRSALVVPMRAQGRVIGVALYAARSAEALRERDIESLVLFTDHVATAFGNGRRVADLQRENERLESELSAMLRELTQTNGRLVQKVKELKTVYDLAVATAASTDVQGIVGLMIERIKEIVEVQGAAFFVYDAESESLQPVAPAFDRAAKEAQPLGGKVAGSALLQRVIRDGEPQFLNLIDAADALPTAWSGLGVRSILALPLREGQDIKGVFCVINKLNGLFSADDARMLSLLTSRVAEVLHRITLDGQLRQQVHDLKVLQDLSGRLPSPPVLSDTLAVVGRVLRGSISRADLCLFFLHHAPSEALVAMGGDWDARFALDLRSLTIGVSEKVPVGEAFRSGEPSQFEQGRSDAGWEQDGLVKMAELRELLYLPLVVDHGTIGVMALGVRYSEDLTVEDRRLAALTCKQVAIMIERSRLYEKLRSANEKLEQINHLKNEFISMVSHELRTPLTTIKGFVSIVLNEETGPLNDQQRHFLETSDRAIDRLTLLVSDLLDISRIEAGQIKMQMRPTSMRDVIQRVATGMGPQFKAQGLTLTVNVAEPLPPVLADPDRVTQVLDNLLSNALKFTNQGGVTITVVDKGDFVMTSVKDMGAGIPKEEQEKIFDKFYQIKAGNTYPGKGTGLGLAIVRSIVESHRGKVWVESEPGKGADFRFLLPRARTDAETPPPTKSRIL